MAKKWTRRGFDTPPPPQTDFLSVYDGGERDRLTRNEVVGGNRRRLCKAQNVNADENYAYQDMRLAA